MKKPTRLPATIAVALSALGLCSGPVIAGTASFDFNTDPTGILNLIGHAQWRETGGVDNSGYLSITDAFNDQRGVVIFDDFDGGAIVNSFEFVAWLRTGGGTASPADGYSVSFARSDDPVIESGGTGFALTPNGVGAELGGLPEEGTTTGVSIGLDEYFNGAPDVIGLSVRVDNVLVNQTALPTLNGAATDTTSLQTGPASVPVDENYDVPGHEFVELRIKMDPDSTLDVEYKGVKILDNFQTTWFPSAGQMVFAGRTGNANSHHHVDNIQITTTAATLPTLTQAVISPFDFSAAITDSASSVIDVTRPFSVTIDGAAVPATISKEGAVTSFAYELTPPAVYASGDHALIINVRDTNNNPVTLERTVVTPAYVLIQEAWKAAAGQVDTNAVGFRARVHQIGFPRYPGDENVLPLPERQIAEGFFDAGAGAIVANLAEPGSEPDGAHIVEGVLNWDEVGGAIGSFPGGETLIPGIPGSTNSTDNIVAEITGWLELPAGITRLGVNSDDGFSLSIGANPLDRFTRTTAGEFNGGRGASDSTFDVAVPVAGIYPIRLLWWEGGGGANLELFSVRIADGTKILVNDEFEPDAIKAYSAGVPALPALHAIAPFPGITDNDPRYPIRVELVDGVATVNDASIVLTVDGTAVTPEITNAGLNTVIVYDPPNLWAPGNHTVSLAYSTNTAVERTETWSFGVVNYATLTATAGVPANGVSVPGFKARIYQVITRGDPIVDTANWNEVADDILAGAYGENVADLAAATGGIFSFSGVLNWDQDGAAIGSFPGGEETIPGIPGTTGSTDNLAGEIKSWAVFPAPGLYTLAVNSDDGFRLSLGHDGPTRNLLQTTGSANVPAILPSVDGTRRFGSIGEPLTGVIEAEVVAADPILADTPLNNAAAVAGKIVYIDRGAVTFAVKILNAQAAGAIAVIVGNSVEGYPITMGGETAGINIPAVMTSLEAGTAIKAALTAGDPLRASLGYDATPILGEFQGGRGASDTAFIVNVQDAGAYPLRLIWKEGNGGANIEWFSVLADGTKVLVNDPANPDSIKIFQEAGAGAAPLEIDSFAVNRPGGTFELVWKSTPGQSFRIDSSLNIAIGSWSVMADNVPAAAGATTTFAGDSNANPQLPNVTTQPQVFFRVFAK